MGDSYRALIYKILLGLHSIGSFALVVLNFPLSSAYTFEVLINQQWLCKYILCKRGIAVVSK